MESERAYQILICEDDTNINHMLKEVLEKQGYVCTQAFSGTEAVMHCRLQAFDLVLLDLMLPGLKGEEVLEKIKEIRKVPVIVVSAREELDKKVELLSMGAEDYITKPFQLPELLARVMVQLRKRSGGGNVGENKLHYKELVLDKELHECQVAGKPLGLTRQEFKILELLLENPKKVFTKQEMYEYAWEDYYLGEDKTINVHISHIRNKLKEVTEEAYIETVWGIGFKLAN